MRLGEKGVIVKVKGHGEMNRRLRDMGLVPGTEILVQGRGAAVRSVNLKIRDNNLTLRNNEADCIFVRVDRGEAA
jgi:ferrous iron transport protein A